MKTKSLILGLALSVSLGGIGGVTYSHLSGDKPASADQIQKVSNGWVKGKEVALDQVPFKDKIKSDAKKLPFEVGSTFSEVMDSQFNDSKVYKQYLFNKNKKSNIAIEVTDAKVIPATALPEEQPLIDVELKDGTKAQYLDNGTLQFLYWEQDGLSYKIEAQKEHKNKTKKYTKEELVRVASNLK